MEKFLKKEMELIEPEHKYILKSEPDLNFTSVTSITSQYFAPFDKDVIAKRLVETNVKYIGMTAEELIAQWDESRDFGTLVHNNIESYINNQTYKDISEVRHAIKWMKKFKNLSEFIFYPEVIIYSKELGIAGSIDVLARDTKNDTHIIIIRSILWMERITFVYSFLSLFVQSGKYLSLWSELKYRSSRFVVFIIIALFFRVVSVFLK